MCLGADGKRLATADPRRDNGMRVTAEEFREQARSSMTRGAPGRVEGAAALAPTIPKLAS